MMKPREAPRWRLLRFESLDPHLNLAIDEAILMAVEAGTAPNTLRLWRNPRSVVLGVCEEIEDEVELAACERLGVQVLRRFTGGGTVYHDQGNLNWTIAVGREPSMFGEIQDISEIFQTFVKPISTALRTLGLEPELRPPASIFIDGMKVSGMAASVKRGAVLCHGSLLLNSNIPVMGQVLKNMKYPVANLSDLVDKRFPDFHMEEEVARRFAEFFEVELVEEQLLEDEWEKAGSLVSAEPPVLRSAVM